MGNLNQMNECRRGQLMVLDYASAVWGDLAVHLPVELVSHPA